MGFQLSHKNNTIAQYLQINSILLAEVIHTVIHLKFVLSYREMTLTRKRGSRHATHAAKALRWRVDQNTKMPYKENNSLLVMVLPYVHGCVVSYI